SLQRTWYSSQDGDAEDVSKPKMLQLTLEDNKDWQKYETARKLKDHVNRIRDEYITRLQNQRYANTTERAVAVYFIDKQILKGSSDEALFVLLNIVQHPEKDDEKKKKKATRSAGAAAEKLKLQATDKEENKQTGLETSKLNYLDPRINVAWCKSVMFQWKRSIINLRGTNLDGPLK
ncbi:hypothetical protein CEXT_477921, partial [Caerostris extrusa]